MTWTTDDTKALARYTNNGWIREIFPEAYDISADGERVPREPDPQPNNNAAYAICDMDSALAADRITEVDVDRYVGYRLELTYLYISSYDETVIANGSDAARVSFDIYTDSVDAVTVNGVINIAGDEYDEEFSSEETTEITITADELGSITIVAEAPSTGKTKEIEIEVIEA